MRSIKCFGSLIRSVTFLSALYVLRVVTGMAFEHFEDSHECKIIRFHTGQHQVCAALHSSAKNEEADWNKYTAVPEVKQPSRDIYRKLVCDIAIGEEMNLMKMNKLPYIERFKNPCWYEENQLRCLPYMHIVGTAKCGSTDLFERIAQHPDFIKPTRKEPSWLSSGRFYRQESFSFYSTTYFSPIAKRLSVINESSNLITGDASVFDMHGSIYWSYLGKNVGLDEPAENNPEYIYHLNSKARILILLRNPVERLWSEYLALSKGANLSAERFHEVVVNVVGMYKGCLKTRSLRSCMYDEPMARYACFTEDERKYFDGIENCRYEGFQTVMLHRGVYHVFIKDYLRVFPRDHVLVQRLEDISRDTEAHLLQTFQFLGLEKPTPTQLKTMLYSGKRNARRPSSVEKGDMLEATRQILYDFYRPHNEQLATIFGDSKYIYGPRG